MDEDEVRKGHHCAWQIHYHVVFPVKYRRALLDEEVVRIIVETAEGIAQRYDIEFESIGCDRDHIHVLCSAHPKVSPGQVVRVFKSITAREVFRRKPGVKKELWGGEFWTDGYDGHDDLLVHHREIVKCCVRGQVRRRFFRGLPIGRL